MAPRKEVTPVDNLRRQITIGIEESSLALIVIEAKATHSRRGIAPTDTSAVRVRSIHPRPTLSHPVDVKIGTAPRFPRSTATIIDRHHRTLSCCRLALSTCLRICNSTDPLRTAGTIPTHRTTDIHRTPTEPDRTIAIGGDNISAARTGIGAAQAIGYAGMTGTMLGIAGMVPGVEA
jgi:hypothetical protein